MFGLALAIFLYGIVFELQTINIIMGNQINYRRAEALFCAIIVGILAELGLRAAIQGCCWPTF
ncbi:MAG: hypothetical protein COV29_01595 [Candidatus Yanofskybacteria bacterium CG10_big_fil_rev_8_21_14_0_10_36_16]|uniref:Uncharacterized protein n=1 Tax=Candidatus Yanofskybacteria bacterium CG10_big_fil_rev_8_21_14_0_10_36_16 TaxID=1975096 RepID=A0A2J0Q7A5_9BACT|nr:MAG: hypothetical protein COV29_01595 [Candidatus Yanofskybacteria bacterium CG10_big_fil_rev_8_21_14_0_10_36_16]